MFISKNISLFQIYTQENLNRYRKLLTTFWMPTVFCSLNVPNIHKLSSRIEPLHYFTSNCFLSFMLDNYLISRQLRRLVSFTMQCFVDVGVMFVGIMNSSNSFFILCMLCTGSTKKYR